MPSQFEKWSLSQWANVANSDRSCIYCQTRVWLFNIVGSLDLIDAIALATLYDAAPFMGPAYWIPAFWVPALIVTHYITFIILLRHSP